MSYPLLRVHLGVMESNMNEIVKQAGSHGLNIWGVTKGISAPLELALMLERTGAAALADSRIMNIRRMKNAGIKKPFVLIRIPMRSELPDVLEYTDCCAVSDLGTMAAISKLCEEKKKEFMKEWQDGRSSLNNIGEYAHQLGEKLKGKG